MLKRALTIAGLVGFVILSACATGPTLGGGGTVATGGAGGATGSNVSPQLRHCDRTLGTLGIEEDETSGWYSTLGGQYHLGSTIPVLRTIVQQSNCFVIVERGRSMNSMMRERDLEASGEMRKKSNFGKGQMVAADYTMQPNINFSQKGTSGLGAGLGGFIPYSGVVGAAVGSVQSNEASTTLLLIDNRSGVQLSASQGSAKNWDIGGIGSVFGGGAAGGFGGYSNSPQGKVLIAAFMDSYNQMVDSLRNYKAQTVEGGLGTGGTLGVQGGTTPASKHVK
ncbi:MAG TPA: CsgG/HfaB family protein [Candidatus Binatia bacterium]|nr:CsgG/HfaB family protein [Candidatus Binatia bacterium]